MLFGSYYYHYHNHLLAIYLFLSYFSGHEYEISGARLKLKAENTPVSLTVQCLRSVVVNMGNMRRSDLQYLPNRYHEHLRKESFIEVQFHLWPRSVRGESITLFVKKGVIISEILLLLESKLSLRNNLEVNLFKNCVRLEDDDFLQTDLGSLDCVFSSCKPMASISPLTSTKDVSICSQFSTPNYFCRTPRNGFRLRMIGFFHLGKFF